MNTQKCIDLKVSKAAQELHQSDQHKNAVKHKSIGHNTISDNSAIIPIANKSKYLKQCNSRCNSNFTIDNELSNQEIEAIIEDLELTTQDQDPDLIAFKEMCEKMSKIQQCDKPKLPAVQINSMKQINIQQVNVNVICCEDQAKHVPSTSKANSSTNFNSLKDNNTFKVLSNEKVKCQTKSSENLNMLSNTHQYKKFKDNTSNNILEINSKPRSYIVNRYKMPRPIKWVVSSTSEDDEYSAKNNKRKKTLINTDKIDSLKQKKCKNFDISSCEMTNEDIQLKTIAKSHSGNIVNNSDDSNKLDLIVSTSTEDEEYYLPAKNGNTNIVTSVKIKYSTKYEPIFCCSPYGQIHEDMLNQINKKK